MACENLTVNGRAARSYVTRSGTPASITIPVGERFANLTAQETPFTVYGQALNSSGNPEAIANLVFRSRVVPLFQFAVFFDKDMEFDNTAQLSFTGPIHSNGNIFLDAGSDVSLSISGQLTGAHDIYRRQKRSNVCTGTVLEKEMEANPTLVSVYGGDATTVGESSHDLTTHSVNKRPMGIFTYKSGTVTPLAYFGIGGEGYTKAG